MVNYTNGVAPSFGKNFAVLNLDLMTVLIDQVKNTAEGPPFVSNCARWNAAVHRKDPRPLTIFTTLYFTNETQPELKKRSPFGNLIGSFGAFAKGSEAVQICPEFQVDKHDIVLQKTRWYAGAGNSLEQILRAQNIDTVILSGLSFSGVILSTIYHLFDLDYTIYVILDNVMELPGERDQEGLMAALWQILEKMQVRIISLGQAITMLERST